MCGARLEEAESKVRVLQLVSVTVEVLGDSAQAHLGAVASALPQVRAHACTCMHMLLAREYTWSITIASGTLHTVLLKWVLSFCNVAVSISSINVHIALQQHCGRC